MSNSLGLSLHIVDRMLPRDSMNHAANEHLLLLSDDRACAQSSLMLWHRLLSVHASCSHVVMTRLNFSGRELSALDVQSSFLGCGTGVKL